MTERTTLLNGPEDDIAILKEIFSKSSKRKASLKDVAKSSGKREGTVRNAFFDLKALKLVNKELMLSGEARNIVYERRQL